MIGTRAAGVEDRLVVQVLRGQLGYVFTADEFEDRLSLLADSYDSF